MKRIVIISIVFVVTIILFAITYGIYEMYTPKDICDLKCNQDDPICVLDIRQCQERQQIHQQNYDPLAF